MDIVTLGAALNGSAEYVNSHFKSGSNIQIVDNPDGTQTINASGEVSSEDTVARAEIAAIKDGETLDSFSDVEAALDDKANTSTTYTKTEVDTALSAKANATDVYSKSEVDTALNGKVDKETGKRLSTNDYTTAEKTKLAGIAEGAEVNEIDGIKVNNTTINPDVNKVVNITVPTTAADVSALPDTTKYATSLSLTINSSTFIMTGQLKDQNGDNLGTAQTIDLPLESVVVGGSYNSQTKKVVLTLQNGNTIEFSVADLVSGLQTELSETNKLNPAYINYDSTHRAVSDAEKSEWNGKQSALTTEQLAAVNSGITEDGVEQIETNKNNILSDNIISTSFTWSNGYASIGGHIFSSTQSYFSQPFTLHAGEKIVVRTKNKNICIIGTTTEDSVAVGDNISVLRTTSSIDQEETYDYTATEDIKIVICVLASNYVAYVANHNTDLLLGSSVTIEQSKTTGMSAGGSDYITVNGIRVYVSATEPTGARTGDLWIGG